MKNCTQTFVIVLFVALSGCALRPRAAMPKTDVVTIPGAVIPEGYLTLEPRHLLPKEVDPVGFSIIGCGKTNIVGWVEHVTVLWTQKSETATARLVFTASAPNAFAVFMRTDPDARLGNSFIIRRRAYGTPWFGSRDITTFPTVITVVLPLEDARELLGFVGRNGHHENQEGIQQAVPRDGR